jgi:uncharacterized protein YprB with RNaseH-like and TPR domain
MLSHTFCHIPRIGVKTESRLWEAGIHTWEDFLARGSGDMGKGLYATARAGLEESLRRLDSRDAGWFQAGLPSAEAWRLYGDFSDKAAFLDIETTGLGARGDHITTIALYAGGELRTYVWGDNLDDFQDHVREFELIVSFNGKCFDQPIIERHFGIELPRAHIDLRYVAASLGLKGGLKSVEKRLGISRDGVDGVDGWFAVLLWNEWDKYADEAALQTLLAYNAADAVNLERLLVHCYNARLERTPFYLGRCLPDANYPQIPFQADMECVERVRSRYGV